MLKNDAIASGKYDDWLSDSNPEHNGA
jgi:hypothetical protein